MDWRNLMKQSVTVGAQLLLGRHYGCNNGRYGCTIVMSYIEINKAVSQWLLTFNLCVSVTWPLTCAFHIPCTHTPEIIDMHRGVCDNTIKGHQRIQTAFKRLEIPAGMSIIFYEAHFIRLLYVWLMLIAYYLRFMFCFLVALVRIVSPIYFRVIPLKLW